jgi:hypothetical protein
LINGEDCLEEFVSEVKETCVRLIEEELILLELLKKKQRIISYQSKKSVIMEMKDTCARLTEELILLELLEKKQRIICY